MDADGNEVPVSESGTDTLNLTVKNVEPSFELVSEQTEVRTDEPYALSVHDYFDPGEDHPIEWKVDWGDGQTSTYPGDQTSFGHQYDGPVDTTYNITVTLTDDDGTYTRNKSVKYKVPRVTVHESARISEFGGGVQVHVERDVPTDDPVTVQLSRGGSAVLGLHYNDTGTQLTIPAGGTHSDGAITVTPVDNQFVNPARTATYHVASAPKHKVGSPASAIITIADDDAIKPGGGGDLPPPPGGGGGGGNPDGGPGNPDGPDNGDGTTEDPTDPGQPDDDTDTEAWVDVAFPLQSWWWDGLWTRTPASSRTAARRTATG
jgi:hypothetical protein